MTMNTEEILKNKKALFIPVEGEIREVEPNNGSDFKLEEIYELLNIELVEVVYMPNDEDKIMLIDEEGMYRQEPNVRASELCTDCYQRPCVIFGDILVVFNKQFK